MKYSRTFVKFANADYGVDQSNHGGRNKFKIENSKLKITEKLTYIGRFLKSLELEANLPAGEAGSLE